MASTVSERPISGTVPSSSLVAGSDERELSVEFNIAIRWQMLTKDLDGLPALCFNPFPANEPFEPDQFWVFQAKLCTTSEVLLGNSQYGVTNRCGVAGGHSQENEVGSAMCGVLREQTAR